MVDTVTNLTGAYAHEAQEIRILEEWGTEIDSTTSTRAPYDAAPYNVAPVSPWVSDTSTDSYTITDWADLLTQLEAAHGTAIVSNTNINNKVDNTSAETVAGIKDFTDNCTTITPVGGTDIAIKSYVDAATPPDATESTKGIAEIATTAETATGTDDVKFITPLKLATEIPSASTTAEGRVELATGVETSTGTDDSRALTAKGLQDAFKDEYVKLRIIADQTSGTTISWDNPIENTGGLYNVSNPTRVTVQSDGTYLITSKTIRAASTSTVTVSIYKNGANTGSGDRTSGTVVAGNLWTSHINGILQLSASDYIEIIYTTAFTVSYDLRYQSSDVYTEIEVQRII